jgi:hypothetical protein
VGNATQAEYDPFQSPDRARRDEFGDLLAEGLYALIGEGNPGVPLDDQLVAATPTFWSRFIDARRKVLAETKAMLENFLDRNQANHRAFSAPLRLGPLKVNSRPSPRKFANASSTPGGRT